MGLWACLGQNCLLRLTALEDLLRLHSCVHIAFRLRMFSRGAWRMEIGTYCVQVWALSLRHGPPAEKVRSKTLMCQIQSQIKFKAASRGEELCVAHW